MSEDLILERIKENKRKGMSEYDAVREARRSALPKGSGPGTDDSLTISAKTDGEDINLGRKTASPVKRAAGAYGAVKSAMARLRGQ